MNRNRLQTSGFGAREATKEHKAFKSYVHFIAWNSVIKK